MKRLARLARNIVVKPISYAAPMPQAIASVLKEATLGAVDMAVLQVEKRRRRRSGNNDGSASSSRDGGKKAAASGSSSGRSKTTANVRTSDAPRDDDEEEDDGDDDLVDIEALIDEAFLPLERSLEEMERSLAGARAAAAEAKSQAADAIEAVQAAAIAQARGAATAVRAAEQRVIDDIFNSTAAVLEDVSGLSFEDVDYDASEMAPPFLGEDQCLVPGEPVCRVEKAPENSRRIFAGIDIMASVDDVWNVLTDYSGLQNVVPNLVVNDVLEMYDGAVASSDGEGDVLTCIDASQPEDIQCQQLSKRMKGALLKQVGGAKVAGINFSARTTLEVREWPRGLPDFAHFNDEMWEGKSRKQRASEYAKVKLRRYSFPRPFAVSSLPTRDISMQSVENDDGEFRMYQGVWRMQPLPGCAPEGQQAMRLTYAVEVSPRAYLPVQLIEGRIVRDLCTNLQAIREYVSDGVPAA